MWRIPSCRSLESAPKVRFGRLVESPEMRGLVLGAPKAKTMHRSGSSLQGATNGARGRYERGAPGITSSYERTKDITSKDA